MTAGGFSPRTPQQARCRYNRVKAEAPKGKAATGKAAKGKAAAPKAPKRKARTSEYELLREENMLVVSRRRGGGVPHPDAAGEA